MRMGPLRVPGEHRAGPPAGRWSGAEPSDPWARGRHRRVPTKPDACAGAGDSLLPCALETAGFHATLERGKIFFLRLRLY